MTTLHQRQTLKSACCSTWTHPLARLLLGDGLHPGGERSTALTIASLDLPTGSHVLDVGSGYGLALRLLSERGYRAVGLELAAEAAAASGGTVVIGDAEAAPFLNGSLDGVVIECVLSLCPDKPRALRHVHRVLRAGGRIAISDVTVERSLPYPLKETATWSMCVAGALSQDAYMELLHATGFSEVEQISLDDELVALVEQARRRFALIEVALKAKRIDPASLGLDRDRLETFRSIAASVLDFIREGGAGYRLFQATRR